MALEWFNTEEVDAFASWVVQDLLQRLPPASLGVNDAKTAERLSRMNEVVSGRARELAATRKLNIYKRGRLGNRVRWGLREAGYPKEFADAVAYELLKVIIVTRPAA
jgi:hypothetical protein